MFQAIPEHIEKLSVYFFLAQVEEALVHGIACRALFFVIRQDAFSTSSILLVSHLTICDLILNTF